MRKILFLFFVLNTLLSVACSENKRTESASAEDTSDSLVSNADGSTTELSSDTLKAGDGTQSQTPADPISGTTSSENGLSTDVGGNTGTPEKSDTLKK